MREEPESINLFRTRVHNAWLVRNCANQRMPRWAGRRRLLPPSIRDEQPRTVYENLLILERTQLDLGDLMIDYEEPEDEPPGVQYVLPRSEARLKHLMVPGSPGVSSGGRDGRHAPLHRRDVPAQAGLPGHLEVPKVEPPETRPRTGSPLNRRPRPDSG